ncbi:biotin-dependent carboxyltransferase family protein [Mesobacterium sp. TK19101]|uniref:Biotin-dependent carboxyltransferase family protein n=1 Tax=Mesobacterium hydrothermale TaxID=3111907 RepID=A0ABU6HGC0_9RHOB|nr:biotin-dependent carboxyltransferase family protein [Mesobacterium sp. TK19101]MEC3861006.1 biotin-dependent carboxyltransferase family protein [Mesobacterium sp. TK19101]
MSLTVLACGPGTTVQDMGRPGALEFGLSRGGAADRLALAEGAALVGNPPDCAALELVLAGGRFRAETDLRLALTGASMPLSVDGAAVPAYTSFALRKGAVLDIGAARAGVYGYLHVAGGIVTPERLGSRSAHLPAGLGKALAAGDTLPTGPAPNGDTDLTLTPEPRLSGGEIRVVESAQSRHFADQLDRFQATEFTRDAHGNRMGVRMASDGPGFAAQGGLRILSEIVVPGDIQITGDGTPFVLLADCQTTGGYPRLATVIPCDLPRIAQAAPGTKLRFRVVTLDDALQAEAAFARHLKALPGQVAPRFRHPADIPDLLGYHLISGVITGHEEEHE